MNSKTWSMEIGVGPGDGKRRDYTVKFQPTPLADIMPPAYGNRLLTTHPPN